MKHLGRDVVVKDNAIPTDKCNAFIDLFDGDKKLIQEFDKEYDGNTKYANMALTTDKTTNIHKLILNQIISSVKEYKELLNIDAFLGDQFEAPEIMKFRCDQDQFDVHFDGNGIDHQRTLALIWYLNDVDEGGELHIPSKFNHITVKPKKGRLVIVPTDWTHYHYVTTPKSCDRYSLITFIRY